MFDLVLACFLGIACGALTGFIPGIHVNTAGAIIFASSTFLLGFLSPEFLCVFLVAMSIAHAMIEFVPSMMLGVPEEGSALSVLPGHRMVLEGRSKEAIRIVSLGGFGAIIVTILMLPVFAILLPATHSFIKPFTCILLFFGSIYMTWRMSNGMRAFGWSLILFILSGIMGWTMFQTPISSGLAMMCIFSGLFGISTILFSLNDGSFIPHQNKFYDLELNKDMIKSTFAGGIAGSILGFLPGFGPAQGGVIVQVAMGSDGEDDTTNFLTSISGLNTSDTLFSLFAIYLIGNPRSGIAVYMNYLIETFSISHLMIFTFTALTSVAISVILCLKLGDSFSRLMENVDYKKLSISVIVLMIAILYIFGIIYKAPLPYLTLMLIASTALGLLPHYLGISKSHLMGVLIVPAMVIYFTMFT
ncbi:tripartite tricarboxylate transporter TctA family protein [Methanobrevibacter cuticularis]|uniref:Tripartite tricarboxylate transporter TctA family protein n=1 Tax=Methanobrevibacter cuticularis TaxID=47311 RepID=A0A166DEQ7_9EURY|nr:tripartite tricarboxylate transporter permease [Methanobrevibacter cuticularis]KZX15516.1 tripartite tricarboxylate transporter TctA family protein [Methanobrevibacter cuticularis]